MEDTIIEDVVIIDNLVQIAHNVKLASTPQLLSMCRYYLVAYRNWTALLIAGAVGIVGHLHYCRWRAYHRQEFGDRFDQWPGSYSSGAALTKKQQRGAKVPILQLESLFQRIRTLEGIKIIHSDYQYTKATVYKR
ncbi:MAG: hypothetical protein IPN27_07590 [Cellvibrionales bacterium]|nr:hypothetical protein [Cellvibrionales bacterium]